MRVDVPGLRACGPAFAALSAAVDETMRRLVDRLDAEGACWGADETGAAFDASYGPSAANVRRALPGLRDAIASVGDSVVAAADNAEAAENRTSNRFE
jgi:hypothetical protein